MRILIIGLLSLSTAAAGPITLTQSVRVLDATGVPLTGTHSVDVRLWDHASNGVPDADEVWVSPTMTRTFADGYTSLSLSLDDALLLGPRWVSIDVDGQTRVDRSVVSRSADVPEHVSIVPSGTSRTWSDGRVAPSCLAYRHPVLPATYTGSIGDGVYRIDPTGGNPADAIDVRCDMTTDGGGWTLIGKSGRGGTSSLTHQQYVNLIANPVDHVNIALLSTSAFPVAGQQAWLNRPITDALWDGSPHQVIRVDVTGTTQVPNDGRYYQRKNGPFTRGGLWTALRDSRLWGRGTTADAVTTGGRDFFVGDGPIYNADSNTFSDENDGHFGWWDVGVLTLNDGSTLEVSRHMGLLCDGVGVRGYQWLLTSNPADSRFKVETTAFNAIIWAK